MTLLKKVILTGATIMILTVASALIFLKNELLVIQLTDVELKQKLDKHLPYVKKMIFSTKLKVSQSRVKLIESSDNIQFGVDVKVEVESGGFLTSNAELKGSFDLNGSISYKPENYTFYLHNPQVVNVELKGISGLAASRIKKSINKALIDRFKNVALYKLKDKKIKQKAAKLLLRKVEVVAGKLNLTLGI